MNNNQKRSTLILPEKLHSDFAKVVKDLETSIQSRLRLLVKNDVKKWAAKLENKDFFNL